MARIDRLTPEQRQRVIARIDKFANLMDTSIAIPRTNWQIGWDGIIGLLPVAGDTAALLLSVIPLIEGKRLGVRRRTMYRMAAHVLIDFFVGLVPLIGDFFDFAYKANIRNANILREEVERFA
jgi:hypothetical protein